ncbi:hypothetical protein DIPPA_04397 [Diplonema papillatum]|nr:hypothetical protein DIPPA_04397 [Diplonema papillatum]
MVASAASNCREEKEFERAISLLEQIVQDDKFQKMREDFMAKNCRRFSIEEENKLFYTDIHSEFLKLVETQIVEQLTREGIDVETLLTELARYADDNRQLDFGASLDIMASLSDFSNFKEMMIKARNQFVGRRAALDPSHESGPPDNVSQGSIS